MANSEHADLLTTHTPLRRRKRSFFKNWLLPASIAGTYHSSTDPASERLLSEYATRDNNKQNLVADGPIGPPDSYITAFWTSMRLPIYRYDQVPHYLQDNKYIQTGYRCAYQYKQSWSSILFVHNELGNIWTHMLGLIVFIYLIIVTQWTMPSQAHYTDHLIFMIYFLSACSCFMFSTCFHTHFCNNRSAYVLFGCLDYAGISILICGSSLIIAFYVHYCNFFLQTMYLIALITVSSVGIIGPYFPIFATARFRLWRTLIYIASGFLSGCPVFHYLIINGIPKDAPWWGVFGIPIMGVVYIGGATIYASKIPERWWPGKFDIIGQSHQLWHIAVVVAALIHGRSAYELMLWRTLQDTCKTP